MERFTRIVDLATNVLRGKSHLLTSDVHGFGYPCGLAGMGLMGTGTGQPKFPRGQPVPVVMGYGLTGRYCRCSQLYSTSFVNKV